MAVYKVPQDVEADDKLIGPFSFRQFIYLIVVAISMAGAWGLSNLFIPLAIIPLPIIVFFGALALPLRKDQPMEAYLSAVVSYYFLKSHKRFWQPDGIDSFVTIIPPKNSDKILTKQFDGDEATKRLGYLSELVDTHGWSIRGSGGAPDTSVNTDLYYESQQANDMMDAGSDSAKALTKQLQDAADTQKGRAISGMKGSSSGSSQNDNTSPSDSAAKSSTQKAKPQTHTVSTPSDSTPKSKLPSLDEVRAKQDASAKQHREKEGQDALSLANSLASGTQTKSGNSTDKTTTTTSASTPDTGTMGLTKQQASDLSQQEGLTVQTIADQAKRVANNNKTLREGDEVVISLH